MTFTAYLNKTNCERHINSTLLSLKMVLARTVTVHRLWLNWKSVEENRPLKG